MGRLLAAFNVLAGGASLVGLYITAFTDYRSWVLALLFVLTAVFVTYVLFVPGNLIERNVAAKLMRHYESPTGTGTITKVQDEFVIDAFSSLQIPFPHPFKEPPEVELIRLSGPGHIRLKVANVTSHKFVVSQDSSAFTVDKATFRWIASGTLLAEAKPSIDGSSVRGQA